MQPVRWDGKGVIRFQKNPIVCLLLDRGGFDMNKLAMLSEEQGWTEEDHSHFAQLIGYSVSGWSSLSYASDEEVGIAFERQRVLREREPTDPVIKP